MRDTCRPTPTVLKARKQNRIGSNEGSRSSTCRKGCKGNSGDCRQGDPRFVKKSPQTAEYVTTYAKVLNELGYTEEAKALDQINLPGGLRRRFPLHLLLMEERGNLEKFRRTHSPSPLQGLDYQNTGFAKTRVVNFPVRL